MYSIYKTLQTKKSGCVSLDISVTSKKSKSRNQEIEMPLAECVFGFLGLTRLLLQQKLYIDPQKTLEKPFDTFCVCLLCFCFSSRFFAVRIVMEQETHKKKMKF